LKTPPLGFLIHPATSPAPHKDIDEKDSYEVVASAKDLLISSPGDLRDKSFVKVSPDDARRYTGHHYRCPTA
jgi:hypothetical protein